MYILAFFNLSWAHAYWVLGLGGTHVTLIFHLPLICFRAWGVPSSRNPLLMTQKCEYIHKIYIHKHTHRKNTARPRWWCTVYGIIGWCYATCRFWMRNFSLQGQKKIKIGERTYAKCRFWSRVILFARVHHVFKSFGSRHFKWDVYGAMLPKIVNLFEENALHVGLFFDSCYVGATSKGVRCDAKCRFSREEHMFTL